MSQLAVALDYHGQHSCIMHASCCNAQANGGTPLWAACEAGHLAVVNALIRSHANVNSVPVETVGAGRVAPAVGCVRWGLSTIYT
jgi:hypothetical protein